MIRIRSRENQAPFRTTHGHRSALWAIGIAFAIIGIGIFLRRAGRIETSWLPGPGGKPGQPWFENVVDQCGIDFRHSSGRQAEPRISHKTIARSEGPTNGQGKLYFPEIMTGGVCLLDYDRDGYLDVYFVQGGRVRGPRDTPLNNRLYRNRRNGNFEDVTVAAGVGGVNYGMGCACADFDNDGWTDIYVTNVGPNVLYRNNRDGTYNDVTASAGVGDPSFSSSAGFLDYDRDGDLDLFVVNYTIWSPDSEIECLTLTDNPDYCGPKNYNAPAPDTLYRNNGDSTFTIASDVLLGSSDPGNGLGISFGDLNGDGWIDVCVANDKTPTQVWINQRDGSFRDEALSRGAAYNGQGVATAGMGIDVRDFDDDLDADLFLTNFAGELNTIFVNDGGYFEDKSIELGLAASRPFTGFGTAIIDFDNDGLMDIYVANGRVVVGHADYTNEDPYVEPNQLFAGTANGIFREVMPRGGTREQLIHSSRGAAFGDYDNDGDVDIFVVNRDARPYVLNNIVGAKRRWVVFDVLNRHGSPAIGARVSMIVGGRSLVRDVNPAYSYCASNDPRVHVGLGEITQVNNVCVTWADGVVERFGDFAVGRIITLQRGDGPSQ